MLLIRLYMSIRLHSLGLGGWKKIFKRSWKEQPLKLSLNNQFPLQFQGKILGIIWEWRTSTIEIIMKLE